MLASYGLLDRMLHRLALGSRVVARASFDFERAMTSRLERDAHLAGRLSECASQAVYITGLARSGTTLLLRILAATGEFRAQTYRDMPFVLAPRLWQRLRGADGRDIEPAERAHGDGVVVDADSPEAFEEVFWKTFCSYSKDDRSLSAEPPSETVLESFATFRRTVCSSTAVQPLRYLSKNNNNVLRIRHLAAQSRAIVLVPYREPRECAASMYRQHLRFSEIQRRQPFAREYMSLLMHHEFGLDCRALFPAVRYMTSGLSPDHPDYWLDYWSAMHVFLLEQPRVPFVFLAYDDLRKQPTAVLPALYSCLGIEKSVESGAAQVRGVPLVYGSAPEFSPSMLLRANTVHASVRADPRNLSFSAKS